MADRKKPPMQWGQSYREVRKGNLGNPQTKPSSASTTPHRPPQTGREAISPSTRKYLRDMRRRLGRTR